MKFLLLLLVIVIALWMIFGRRRGAPPEPPRAPGGAKAGEGPQPMLVCAQCGVHLPRADAVQDEQARAFCSEAHRLAGPR